MIPVPPAEEPNSSHERHFTGEVANQRLAATLRGRIRSWLERNRKSWVLVALLLIAAFAFAITQDPETAPVWVAGQGLVMSLTLGAGLEICRASGESRGVSRLLDVCTAVAVLPFLALALVVGVAGMILPGDQGISLDGGNDYKIAWLGILVAGPLGVPIFVAGMVIARRRGSEWDERLHALGWVLLLALGASIALFPSNINIGAPGMIVLFALCVYGPPLRRIVWPFVRHFPPPAPIYHSLQGR